MSARFLLDTNACIAVMNQRPPSVRLRMMEQAVDTVAVSSITRFELQFGVLRSTWVEQNRRTLNGFLSYVQVLPFGDEQADEAAAIRIELERRGTPIGPFDTLIAAHSRSIGAALVTHNTREFSRVSELHVLDWEVAG